MDRATSDFYDRHVERVPHEEAPLSAMSAHFAAAFAPGARVLDVGAGSGRDLAVLMAQGVEAYGIEPNAAMRALALERHPALEGRIAEATLPALGQPFGGGFDGVVCSAVLMHVRPQELAGALAALCAVLRPRGRMLLSVPELAPDVLEDGRDAEGRLFANHAPGTIARELAAFGLQPAGRWEQVAGAGPWETRWTVLRFDSAA